MAVKWAYLPLLLFPLAPIFAHAQTNESVQVLEADAQTCLVTLSVFVIIPFLLILFALYFGIRHLSTDRFSDEGVARRNRMLYCLMGVLIVGFVYVTVDYLADDPIPLTSCAGLAQEQAEERIEGPQPAESSPVEPPFTSSTLLLHRGWNLIATPVILDDDNMSRALEGVNYTVVYSFRPDQCPYGEVGERCWRYLLKNGTGDLVRFELDRGYWLHVPEAASVTLSGRLPQTTRNVSLAPGWNIVSYVGESARHPATVFEGLIYDSVYTWDPRRAEDHPTYNGWTGYVLFGSNRSRPPLPPAFADDVSLAGSHAYLTRIDPIRGYYLYSSVRQQWVYETGYDLSKYNVTTTSIES